MTPSLLATDPTPPFVSVIIPTYNRKESLLRTLLTIVPFAIKLHGGRCIPNQDAHLSALSDALQDVWQEER